MLGPNPTPEDVTARWQRRLALYVLAPLLLLLEIPGVIHVSQKPTFGMTVLNLTVRSVERDSPAAQAGIAAGDRVLGIDGVMLKTMVDYYVATAGHYALEPRSFLLRDAERLRTVTVRPVRPSRHEIVRGNGQSLAGFAFLLMGWLILHRRHDMVARYFFGLSAAFAFFLMDVPDWPAHTYMTVKEIARDLGTLALPVIFLRFCLYFPDRALLTDRTRRRHRLLQIPGAVLFLGSLVAHATRQDPASSLLVSLIQQVSGLYFAAYILAGLVVFVRKALRRGRPLERTRMRLVLITSLAGFVPFLLGSILYAASSTPVLPLQPWYGFALAIVPFGFAVAILRYGALDLDYVVRHGLVYALLTLLVVLAYAVMVGVIGHWLTAYFHSSELPFVLLTVIGLSLVLNPVRHRLHRWIDRTFYPARAATREALQELGHELAELVERPDAPRRMLELLHGLYHARHVSLFLAADGAFVFHALHGEGTTEPATRSLPGDGTLPRALAAAHRPIHTEEIDGLDTHAATDAPTQELLRELDVQLVVPLISGERLRGFLTLGPKHGGSLYNESDVGNLHAFSVQAAALIEIVRLHRESLARKQLETELSVARRIQGHLVPREPLLVSGARLLGRMEPSREVGGDYFDYFSLDGNRVGFAIGDVAGKGVPAALQMTSLRVAFRSAAARLDEPAAVIASLDRTIADLGEAALLVSFFYGIYDPATRRVVYSNAGMNPPLLLREGRDYVERLKKGGLMLGIDPERRHQRGILELSPGDLLALYTDGFDEQTDAAGVFFGEERLVSAVIEHRELALDDLCERIFATVEAWGGPERSDDRTLMLLRINRL